MYYLLEYYNTDKWLPAGFVLEGDFHKHANVMEAMRVECGCDFKCTRISSVEAVGYVALGLRLMHAPD